MWFISGFDTMLQYFQCPTCMPREALAKEINDEPAFDIGTLIITTDLIICNRVVQYIEVSYQDPSSTRGLLT